ncbi:polysaccharide biosynthesis protein, partial [Legionella pneumophila]|uniref:polysaccharide biosynthesis protein n=1 Tax=Legionella pneumophila TaxID=446 RepID=UPI003EECA7A0
MFNDKTILITGGTGSFGRMFTSVILSRYKPKKIIIYSRDEYKQFTMNQGASLRANCVGGKRKHRAHGLYNAV